MADNETQPAAEPSGTEPGKRLESWKEIAAFLKRDIRTVKRWEKTEGLPVRRHVHLRQASVYAYEGELEAWRANRRPALEAESANGKEAGMQGRRWVWLAAAAAVVVAALGMGVWWARPPALPFAERDWVLISHFENRTGEAVFEGAVEYALERELSNSRFVNVVPRERIQDALRLMRRSSDTPVDAQVGREVCLRDGGIRALITGRLEKLDTTYVLSVALVNPQTGVTVASFSEQAEGQRAVVGAVQQLAGRVRKALGEELTSVERSEQKLAKVTTPSLRALQLFTQADVVIGMVDNATAEELLRQAISEDPEFASAYMHLAHAIRNQGRPQQEWLPYADKAMQLSGQATERERFFIRASYYGMTGQGEKAIATYEALLRLYPDHFWANNNMSDHLLRQGRYEEAARYQGEAARLRPNSLNWNLAAAGELSRWATRPFEGQPYVQRVFELASPGKAGERPREARTPEESEPVARSLVWMEFYPAREYWLEGRLDDALHEATLKAEQLKSRSGPDRDMLARQLRQFYLTLGKFSAAEGVSTDSDDRILIAFVRNDTQALRRSLRQALDQKKEVGPVEMILAARLGMIPEAEQALRIVESGNFTPFWANWSAQDVKEATSKIMRGELARARGRTVEALSLLEEGFRQLPPLGLNTYFLAAESLADLYEQQGRADQAVDVLRKAGGEKRRAVYYAGQATLLWMQNQVRLAQLYRRLGRAAEAEEVEAELDKLLAVADPDHPIRIQLQERARSSAPPPAPGP